MNLMDYETGQQPCNEFKPKDEVFPGTGNRHDCPDCCGTRSYCEHCGHDHHSEGWDKCAAKAVRDRADLLAACKLALLTIENLRHPETIDMEDKLVFAITKAEGQPT